MNINKHVTTDNLDVATPQPPHILSAATRQHAPRRWDTILAHYAGGLAAGSLAWWLSPEWAHNYVMVAGLGLGTLAVAKQIFTDMIAGVPVRTYRNRVSADTIVAGVVDAAKADAMRALPNVSSYSPSISHSAHTVDGQILEDSAALPAPVNVGPLAIAEWLPRLDEQPHAIFAAKTKGGKSTMAKAGLKARIERGEDIFIIDPHSNGWLDLPGVGGGLNWVEVEAGMQAIIDTYQDRMKQREEYIQETGRELPHDHFPRITVVFDEANESRTMISALHSPKSNPWPRFVEIMGSGARKVGISLWLICQSALIKNLGGSVVLRRNFTIFALDHATVVELIEDEEPIKERREAIITQLGGQTFPAATVLNGQAFLLDRTGLNTMQPGSAADCAWAGWDYLNRTPRNARRLLSKQKPETAMRASARVDAMRPAMDSTPAKAQKAPENATPRPVMQSITHNKLDEWQRDELVRILFRKGWTYRQVREGIAKAGLTVDQNRLTMLRNEAMNG